MPVFVSGDPVLAEHVRLYPPAEVTLPWHDRAILKRHGKPVTRRLLFTRPYSASLYLHVVFNRFLDYSRGRPRASLSCVG